MMGERSWDREGVEMGGSMEGMGLLPVVTELQREKVRRQVQGTVNQLEGIFSTLSGLEFEGYEIHVGDTKRREDVCQQDKTEAAFVTGSGKNVYGTYIHGIFDKAEIVAALVGALAKKKDILLNQREWMDYRNFKETQYDKMADILSEYLDMEGVYGMLREAHIK